MDVEQLHVVLQQSFNPDSNLRTPAENTIRNLKHIKGATSLLLQVAAERKVQFEVRQAAAIQLKNICRECWVERVNFAGHVIPSSESSPASPDGSSSNVNKPPLLDAEDKALVRSGLVSALLDEPEKSVRDLFAETLHNIVIHDFPQEWPDLIPALLQTISLYPAQPLRVHNALLALRKVCKRYEYKSKPQRGPLNDIVRQSFPLLLPLAQSLSSPEEHSLEAAMMLKQCLKIFWSSTQFYLPGGSGQDPSPALANPESMQPWFDILQKALIKPLPEATTGLEPRNQPTSVEERNAWPWWKVKKWAVQIMARLFSRYGIPTYAEEEAKEFARFFSRHVATQFLGPVCETLNLRPAGQFCTDRVVHSCLSFVDLAVELSSTYKLLKPHLDFLLYKVCFPTMCLTPDDIELFENDPHEFVHRQNSLLADYYDPRMSAITLVTDLVKHRGQDVTQSLLGHMTEILHRYNATPPETRNHVEKDGALLTFGSLAKYLLAKEKYVRDIEGLLVTSVFPDFSSPVAFLRYRACWMVEQFSTVPWSDDGTHLRNLLQMVLASLSDQALPVQIEASKALRFLIEAEGADETLLPVLPQLLTEYFRIMNEIGNDEVVSALQVLLDKFGDHIEPHAMALVNQLTKAFHQYCTAGEVEDDDDAAMAASQCLECIATVLKGICDKPSMLKQLEPHLLPLVLTIMGNDGEYIEYLESAMDILTFLTYFPETLSPELWQAFPLIYTAFDQWAYDYLNMMVPCLQSYITKAPDIFLASRAPLVESSVPYMDLIVSMVAKTVTNDRATESECRYALSLFMCVLHNCTGKIDAYLPIMNEIVLGKLGQQIHAQVPLTRIAIYQVLGSALYYNPQLELAELEKRNVTSQVFGKWMDDAKSSMDRWLPRKLTIMGLAAILSLPTTNLPPSIATSIPNLIANLAHMSLALKADAEKGADSNAANAASPNDNAATAAGADGASKSNAITQAPGTAAEEIGDVDQGFGEDEDVTNEVDEAYRKALQGATAWDDDISNFLLGGDWDDDGEDLDEDFSSPVVDGVDELLYLSDTLNRAFQREPEVYQQIQAALPADTLASCQKLFAAAESIRAQAAQQSTQQS